MTIRALMVDVDGVLVDGRPQDGQHWSTGLEADLGLQSSAVQQEFFRPYWDDIVVGRASLVESLRPALQAMAPHITVDQFVAYWLKNDSRLVVPLLEELSSIRAAGIRVYLATNQEHVRAEYLMRDLDLLNAVDGIYYSAQLGMKKPDPAFFAAILADAGLQAGEVLFIDDSQQNIQAASEAGWQTLHWTNATSPEMIRSILERENGVR